MPERVASGDGSSRKVLRALLAFTIERPRHSAESLAEQIGLPLSSTYRYIAILREAQLIDEDGRGSFVLAPRVIGLAHAARARSDLATIARPFMRRLSLEVGETVLVLRRSGDRAVCIERAESASQIRLTYEIGAAIPLHRGAGPKLLLAHLSLAKADSILDELAARDPLFAAQRSALITDLALFRDQGWSESHGEITAGTYSVAVPIRNECGVIAIISVVAPTVRMPKGGLLRTRERLQRAAADISNAYAAALVDARPVR